MPKKINFSEAEKALDINFKRMFVQKLIDMTEKEQKAENGEEIIEIKTEENTRKKEIDEIFEEIIIDDIQDEPTSKWGKFFSLATSFLFVRVFIFMVGLFSVLWFGYSVAMMTIMSILHLVTLMQAPWVYESLKKYWANVKLGAVCSVGLVIALFSPSFGVTIITAYCMVTSEDRHVNFLLRFLESRLREFNGDDFN